MGGYFNKTLIDPLQGRSERSFFFPKIKLARIREDEGRTSPEASEVLVAEVPIQQPALTWRGFTDGWQGAEHQETG